MNPIRINIPDAKPRQIEQAAGQIVMDALVEAGMNPRNPLVPTHPMVRDCLGMWGRGEWTRADFVKAMQNLLIMNPKLAG